MLGSPGLGRQGQVSEALKDVWIFSPVKSRTSAGLQKMDGRGKSGSQKDPSFFARLQPPHPVRYSAMLFCHLRVRRLRGPLFPSRPHCLSADPHQLLPGPPSFLTPSPQPL